MAVLLEGQKGHQALIHVWMNTYHITNLKKKKILFCFFWEGVKMKSKVSPESVLSKSLPFWQGKSEACISSGPRHRAICQCQKVLNWVVKWIWGNVGLTQFNFITQEWLLCILWFQLAAVCILPLSALSVLRIWMFWKKSVFSFPSAESQNECARSVVAEKLGELKYVLLFSNASRTSDWLICSFS